MTHPAPRKHSRPLHPAARAPGAVIRWGYLALACVSLVLAIIGVILPIMPTTVFVLIATWAAARSSPRMHAWLLNHRVFGPTLENWYNGQRVSRRAKWTAALFMTASSVWLGYSVRPWWVAALPIAAMITVLIWLWSRPEPLPKCPDRPQR